MQVKLGCLIITCLLLAGCDKPAGKTAKTTNTSTTSTTKGTTSDSSGAADLPQTGDSTSTVATDTPSTAKTASAGPDLGAAAVRAPVESGVAKLTPENTKILFVGTHVGPKPDPRTGGFEKFTGEAVVDDENKTLKSVEVDIDTTSIWTQFGNLTRHLNTPDFFDTREYPKAKFVSKSIKPGQDPGAVEITGDLTLLAETKEIKVPATVSVDDGGLALKADFKIDRTEFGMDRLVDRVEKPVALTVVIGEKTEPLPEASR
jgi:polyisoprenoid-binding protein YceI